MNALAERVRDSLLAKRPEWSVCVHLLETGDLEVAVPAPGGSRARHLVIFTRAGECVWIRFAPPRMAYLVESDVEMHAVIAALLSDDAFFVVVTNGDEWVETTIMRPGQEPILEEGQVANIVSWSGTHDRIVTHTR